MMRPLRCLMNGRVSALVKLNAPLRLVLITVSHSSSLMRMSRLSRVTPALFTRMSTRPASSRIFPAAASTAAVSDTSTATAQARRPSASTSAAALAEFSSVRETQATSAPILA